MEIFMTTKDSGFRNVGKETGKNRKLWNIIVCFILAVGMIALPTAGFSGTSQTVQASASEAKKAFRDFLSKGYWGDSTDRIYDPSSISFCYMKIGENKTPVLLAKNDAASHAAGYVGIYQYIDGKVKCMGLSDSVAVLYSKSGVIALEHTGGGYGTRDVTYYRLNSGDIMEECAFTSILYKKDWKDEYDSLRKMNGPDQYSINGKSVSKSEFQKFKKEIKGRDKNKASKIKFRKNTASNRKKYVK